MINSNLILEKLQYFIQFSTKRYKIIGFKRIVYITIQIIYNQLISLSYSIIIKNHPNFYKHLFHLLSKSN